MHTYISCRPKPDVSPLPELGLKPLLLQFMIKAHSCSAPEAIGHLEIPHSVQGGVVFT